MASKKIDINKASVEDFEKVNGIGLRKAKAIIKYRKVSFSHGHYFKFLEKWTLKVFTYCQAWALYSYTVFVLLIVEGLTVSYSCLHFTNLFHL